MGGFGGRRARRPTEPVAGRRRRRALDRTAVVVGIVRFLFNVDHRRHHPDFDVYAATNGLVALNKPLTTQHRRCSARSLPPAVPTGFTVGLAQLARISIARRSSHAIT